MSTQLRRIAQAPAHAPSRTRYFLAVADATSPSEGIVTITGVVQSVMTQTEFVDVTAGFGTLISGRLYQDLGREVVVTDNDGNHIQKWRQIRLIDGPASAGVGGSAPDWESNLMVMVWSSDGSYVNVVRTG